MDHSTYIREVPGSDTAVLMMHGILGTPRHFDMLLPLIPETWSVYNILLPGHGGTTSEFGRSSITAWRGYALAQFGALCEKYHRVVLVGHSMGTLFAIRMALAKPEKVPFLLLLAVPLSICMKPVMVENALRVTFGRVREEDPRQRATRDACSVQTTLRLWQYLNWIPRFLELFREIRDVRRVLPLLKTPCYAFQSGRDELVALRASRILQNSTGAQVTILPDSGHYYYPDADREEILHTFRKLCGEPEQGIP